MNVKRASASAQGGDVTAVLARADVEKKAVQVWAGEQEGAAHQAFEEARQKIEAEHPVKSRNRLYLVYCTGCGHIVTATPAVGNLQEGLADINRFHDLVGLYIQAAQQQRATRALKAGLDGLGELLNEE